MHSGMDVRQAVAVLDLALGGVHAELGSEVFDWTGAPKPVVPKPMAVVTLQEPGSQVTRDQDVPVVRALDIRAPEPVMAAPKPVRAPVVEESGKVWSEGEAGGVVLVVQGGMPDAKCQMLAKAMLAAAGVQDVAVAWVGFSGKVAGKEIMDAMRGLAPQHVLVLGQAPLGALLGRNLGVEGWHAADSKIVEGWDGRVGVTYPLELLVKQPLFKRLAWQHLLAWGDDVTVKEGV